MFKYIDLILHDIENQYKKECGAMNIPDPIEIMENNIERMINEWDGESCMSCGKKVDYELISLNARPDSPAVCYDCLSPDDKIKYDDFCNRERGK